MRATPIATKCVDVQLEAGEVQMVQMNGSRPWPDSYRASLNVIVLRMSDRAPSPCENSGPMLAPNYLALSQFAIAKAPQTKGIGVPEGSG
jgi:hypothetical protein